MGTVYVNLTYQIDDGDDKAGIESAFADEMAMKIGNAGGSITSASLSSDTTGMINLHDRHATLAANVPAEHPRETGPAAQGVGTGPQGHGATKAAGTVKKAAPRRRRK